MSVAVSQELFTLEQEWESFESHVLNKIIFDVEVELDHYLNKDGTPNKFHINYTLSVNGDYAEWVSWYKSLINDVSRVNKSLKWYKSNLIYSYGEAASFHEEMKILTTKLLYIRRLFKALYNMSKAL